MFQCDWMPLQFLLSIAQGLHIGGGASGEVVLSPSDCRCPSYQESPMNFFCCCSVWSGFCFMALQKLEALRRNHTASFDPSQAGHM